MVRHDQVQLADPSNHFMALSSFALPIGLQQHLKEMTVSNPAVEPHKNAKIAFTEWLFVPGQRPAPGYDNMGGAIDTAGFLNMLLRNSGIILISTRPAFSSLEDLKEARTGLRRSGILGAALVRRRKSQAGWSPPRVMLQCMRWNMESIVCRTLITFPGWRWWRRWARPPTGLFYSASIGILLAIFAAAIQVDGFVPGRPGANEDHLGAQHLYGKQRNAAKWK